MPFQQDETVAKAVAGIFGDYRTTFRSENGEVLAHVFEQGGWLVAHVSMPTGLEVYEITDSYLAELEQFAQEQGFEDRFRIVYAEGSRVREIGASQNGHDGDSRRALADGRGKE